MATIVGQNKRGHGTANATRRPCRVVVKLGTKVLYTSRVMHSGNTPKKIEQYVLRCLRAEGVTIPTGASAETLWLDEENAAHESRAETPKAATTEKPRDPYQVLGVMVGATVEEITKAYKNMARMYHPDKVESLAPEYREIASSRMREINAAYDLLRSRH